MSEGSCGHSTEFGKHLGTGIVQGSLIGRWLTIKVGCATFLYYNCWWGEIVGVNDCNSHISHAQPDALSFVLIALILFQILSVADRT